MTQYEDPKPDQPSSVAILFRNYNRWKGRSTADWHFYPQTSHSTSTWSRPYRSQLLALEAAKALGWKHIKLEGRMINLE